MTATKTHIAPETFMGVPVPSGLAHHWDHVHAIWWRNGVRAAVNDIQEDFRTIDFTQRFNDDPGETK